MSKNTNGNRKRKTYTAQFKAKLVLEVLKEEKSLNEIASSNEVLPKSLLEWKKQFLENMSLAFDKSTVVKEYKEEIVLLQKSNDELAKKVGNLTIEKDFLQGKLKSSVSSKNRKKLLETGLKLSINRQLKLLSIPKSSTYYKPIIPFGSDEDKKLLDAIDAIYTKHPYYGYRRVHRLLLRVGFAYLAAVIDWHAKKILAWNLSNSMDGSLTTGVLKEALALYPRPEIFNTDQGSQYTAHEHIKILVEHNISISMDGKGRATDNIAIERFWRSLKYEDVYPQRYSTLKEARAGIGEYIKMYNSERLHSTLDYQTPDEVYFKGVNNTTHPKRDVLQNVA